MSMSPYRHDEPRRGGPFLDRLVADRLASTDRLLAAVAHHRVTPEDAALKVLAAAASEAGERWERAVWSAATSLAATAAVSHALVTLAHAQTPRRRTRGDVVFTTAEDETHVLPAQMMATALGMRGWRVDVIRSPIPPADLVPFLTAVRPVALAVSCTMTICLPGVAACVAAAHEAGVPVVAGGAAFGTSPARAALVGADAWSSTIDGLERVLDRFRDGRPLAPPAAARTAEIGQLRDVLAEAWRVTLRTQLDGARAAWFEEWVPFALRSLEVAVALDDDDVLVHDLAWLDRATSHRFAGPDGLQAMLAPLHRLLPPRDVRAATLLRSAAERVEAGRGVDPRHWVDHENGDPAVKPRAHPSAARGREDSFDEFAFVAAATCSAPIAVIGVFDGERLVVKGAYGTDLREAVPPPLWWEELFVADTVFGDSHPVAHGLGPTFYGRIVLRDAQGTPYGGLVVVNPGGRQATAVQQAALRSIARQVEARLAAWDADRATAIVDGELLPSLPEDILRELDAGPGTDPLLRTAHVARLFQVSPRTVNNWVTQGRLAAIETAGGHRRYRYSDVVALFRAHGGSPATP
jgi:excisionase family DNA binding protein